MFLIQNMRIVNDKKRDVFFPGEVDDSYFAFFYAHTSENAVDVRVYENGIVPNYLFPIFFAIFRFKAWFSIHIFCAA